MTTTLTENEFQTNGENSLEPEAKVDTQVFGEKVGFLVSLFGCGHRNLSRPFSHKTVAYRSCLQCGARKQFDTQTLQTFGRFYNSPSASVSAL